MKKEKIGMPLHLEDFTLFSIGEDGIWFDGTHFSVKVHLGFMFYTFHNYKERINTSSHYHWYDLKQFATKVINNISQKKYNIRRA